MPANLRGFSPHSLMPSADRPNRRGRSLTHGRLQPLRRCAAPLPAAA
ncbi:MAG TPA: hypothetical protein VLF18_19780 [Tahibacter sp.]|nr:hypothetical protein [Tahibacter sp.]